MAGALLLGFLLIPPLLQLVALLVALRRGVAPRVLVIGSVVLGAALILAGTALDIGRGSDGAPSTSPVPDWAIGALLAIAIFIETVIVVALVEPEDG